MEWAPISGQLGGFACLADVHIHTDDRLALRLVVEEAVDLGDSTVVGDNRKAVVGRVQDQVLAHCTIVRELHRARRLRFYLLTAWGSQRKSS